MKKTVIYIAIAAIASATLAGCGSKKQALHSASTEVILPFQGKEYRSDKNFFRATQVGRSPDLATAKKIALLNARSELATNIQAVVKRVAENYTNQRTVGDPQEFANKFDENIREVVNNTLGEANIIGEKVFKESNGINYYIAIEMSKEAFGNALADRISKDAKLQLDFDKHQFLKTYDEEMAKLENQ